MVFIYELFMSLRRLLITCASFKLNQLFLHIDSVCYSSLIFYIHIKTVYSNRWIVKHHLHYWIFKHSVNSYNRTIVQHFTFANWFSVLSCARSDKKPLITNFSIYTLIVGTGLKALLLNIGMECHLLVLVHGWVNCYMG